MDRRDFLKSLIVAVVGAPIASRIMGEPEYTSQMMQDPEWGPPCEVGNYLEVSDFSGEIIDYSMEIILQNYRFVVFESGYYKKHGEMEIIKKIFRSDEHGWDHYTIGWKCTVLPNLKKPMPREYYGG